MKCFYGFGLWFLISSRLVCAETLDMNDFQGILAATYNYTGVYNGVSGALEYQFLSYPSLGEGGREARMSFAAQDHSKNQTITMYGINMAIHRSRYTDESIDYTQYYDPPWSLTPRFVAIGGSYNSQGRYTYTFNGIAFTGVINANIQIVGTETVVLSIGSFEAVKARASVLVTESWNSGWIQVNQVQTLWYVRGVGMVKQLVFSDLSTSTGDQSSSTTNIALNSASVPLPTNPVIPSTTWGKFNKSGTHVDTGSWLGYLEVSNAPWVFSYNEGHYFYIPESTANAGRGWMYSP